MNDDYEFTSDWFSVHIPAWERWMAMLPERKRFLEIGSYEGRSALWLAGKLDEDGEVQCVDPWIGNGEHAAPGQPIEDKFERFQRNIEIYNNTFTKQNGTAISYVRDNSFDELVRLNKCVSQFFDFIYIDGSHIAKDCLTDCILAWPLLKPAGLMVIDDYIWGDGSHANLSPKWAIDVFTSMWGGELDIVGHGNQVVVRKRVAG
jgi:predicted O-methyltransferase YrrM